MPEHWDGRVSERKLQSGIWQAAEKLELLLRSTLGG
jgi:hypothetical protein